MASSDSDSDSDAAPPGMAPPPGVTGKRKASQITGEEQGKAQGEAQTTAEAAPLMKEAEAEVEEAAEDAQKKKKKKRKWARRQVEQTDNSRYQAEEGSSDYNIYYSKFSGQKKAAEKATTRLDAERDSGMTKADIISKGKSYFCIHFARGKCAQGPQCRYLHRVPTWEDVKRVDLMHDIFGRKRFSSDRDDMDGVGSFTRNSRTLYITNFFLQRRSEHVPHAEPGGAKRAKQGAPAESSRLSMMDSQYDVPAIRETLARHFGVWGPMEEISVKTAHGCAFIRYRHRCFAEFAKAAMAEQPLDHDEQALVRWAFDDPNPKAIRRVQGEKESLVIAALEAKGYDLSKEATGFELPKNYALTKPADEGAVRVHAPDGTTSSVPLPSGQQWYPDTDQQYGEQQPAQNAAYWQQQAQYQASVAAQPTCTGYVQNADGTLTYHYSNGASYRYDAQGQLVPPS